MMASFLAQWMPALAAIHLAAACSQSSQPTAAEIVAAERAFAADGFERGVKASFLAFSAADAIVFAPAPENAQAAFGAAPDPDPENPRPPLVWWPLYAGISKSGDLGFTTGPYAVGDERRGHYFTIWKKQIDGSWKWVLDAGVGADASAEAAQGSPVAFLETSRSGSASPEAAMGEVAAIERLIAVAAASDVSSAYEPYLDADSRLHSDGPPPAKEKSAHAAALAARPGRLDMAPLGGGASAAGDLVWTYGKARAPDAAGTGYYVRLWQRRENGWRIAFDEFLPPPPASAAQ